MARPLTEIDIAEIYYNDTAITNKSTGGKSVYVSTSKSGGLDNKLTFMLSPRSIDPNNDADIQGLPSSPYGLSDPMAGSTNTSRLTLDVTIETDEAREWLASLDQRNLQAAKDNCQEWFKKTIEDGKINDMYSAIVREPSSEKYKPTVRVKVQTDGDRATRIFMCHPGEGELNYDEGTHKDLRKGCKLLIICETSGLWFQSRGFGMSFTATEIFVWSKGRPRGVDAAQFENIIKKNKVSISSKIDEDELDEPLM